VERLREIGSNDKIQPGKRIRGTPKKKDASDETEE